MKSFEIAAMISVSLTDDVKSALELVKPDIALYVGGMSANGKNFHHDKMADTGFREAAVKIQELYLAGRQQ